MPLASSIMYYFFFFNKSTVLGMGLV